MALRNNETAAKYFVFLATRFAGELRPPGSLSVDNLQELLRASRSNSR